MDMQDKILTALKKKVEDAGFEWVVHRTWANIGNVYVQVAGAFDNVLTFHYDFQSGHCSLQFYPESEEPVGTCGFTHDKALKHYGYLQYSETARITEMLAFVEAHLKKAAKPARTTP